VTWERSDATGRTVRAGVYFYRLRVDGRIVSARTMIVLE